MNVTSRRNNLRALTFREVLFVIAVTTLCALVLAPALIRAKQRRLRLACVNNLKRTGLGFRIWSGDMDGFPMNDSTNRGGTQQFIADGNAFRHFQSLSNELGGDTKFLVCPADHRQPAVDFKNMASSNVSYFVAVDADESYPQMPLCGDRNLTTNGVKLTSGLVTIASSATVGWSSEVHNNVGNACMSDGSVQQVNFIKLIPSQLRNTNYLRLAIP